MAESALFTFVVTFAAAGLAAVVATPAARRLAGALGVVAQPRTDRWHGKTAIPLLGGLAIWFGALVGTLVAGQTGPHTWLVLGAGTALFSLGIVDDVCGLRPVVKLIVQIGVACALVSLGVTLPWTGSQVLNALITVLWIVGTANAFNLLDNMDGLCAGIAVVTAVALCLSVRHADPGAFAVGAALAGAAAGFLVFNFKPASIFMGDSGSLFLGSSLAVLACVGDSPAQRGVASAIAVPVLLMLIPIFDTTFVTLSRKLSSRRVSVGGRDHTSHRLVALGLSERQAVLFLCGLAALAGAAAVGISGAQFRQADILLGLLVVALLLLGVRLAHVRVYNGDDFVVLRQRPLTPLVADFVYKRRVFEVILDVFLVVIAYYTSWVLRFERDLPEYYGAFVRSVPIVIGCQIASFQIAGVYGGVWRYVSVGDILPYARGIVLAVLSSIVMIVYVTRFEGFSRGVFLIDAMVLALLLAGSRASFRLVGELSRRYAKGRERALIYGAGDGGAMLVRELRNNPAYDYRLIGFVDDEPSKQGRRILGLSVLGGIETLEATLAEMRPDVLILSTTSIAGDRLARVRRECFASGTKVLEFSFQLTAVGGEKRAVS
jgi:UDP-GlcNAc:undecaprenyl-phosphate GlcNAc-1-phosphate transferase